MTLRRALILVKRYMVIAIIATLTGMAVSYVGALAWNKGVKPAWEGTASIVVPVEFDGQTPTEAELTAGVLAAKEIGAVANQADLRRGDASITVNSGDGTMSFVAAGRSNDEAKQRASGMRQRYIEAAATAADVGPRLEAQFAEAKRIQNEILRIQREANSVPNAPEAYMTSLQVEISTMMEEIEAVEKESVALAVQKLLSEDEEEIADLDGQILLLTNQSAALRKELVERIDTFEYLGGEVEDSAQAGSGSAGAAEPGTVDIPSDPISRDDWLLDALVSRYSTLQDQYGEALAGTIGSPTLPPVVAANVSLPKVSPLLSAAVGGLSLLLAVAGVILLRDVTKKPLWSEHDLGSVVAIKIPDRRRSSASAGGSVRRGRTAVGEKRRIGLLRLNRLVATAIEHQTKVLAVATIDAHPKAAIDLTVDLARGLARGEWRVALLDAASSSGLEASVDEAHVRSLADIITAAKANRPNLAKMLIAQSPRLGDDITYIVTGDLAPERLASAAVGEAIRLLRNYFDSVLVITDPVGDPVSDSLIARADALIPVTALGRTPKSSLDDLKDQAERDGVELLAVVLSTRPAGWGLRRSISRIRRTIGTPGQRTPQHATSRLGAANGDLSDDRYAGTTNASANPANSGTD